MDLADVLLEVVLRVELFAALVAVVPQRHLGLVLAHALLTQVTLHVSHELGPFPDGWAGLREITWCAKELHLVYLKSLLTKKCCCISSKMSIRSALTVDILTNLLMITCNSIPERLSTRVAGQQATAVPLPDVVLQARAGHVVLPAEGALVRTRRRLALGTIHVYTRII